MNNPHHIEPDPDLEALCATLDKRALAQLVTLLCRENLVCAKSIQWHITEIRRSALWERWRYLEAQAEARYAELRRIVDAGEPRTVDRQIQRIAASRRWETALSQADRAREKYEATWTRRAE